MHTIETLERACADAWPPLVEDQIGDWRLRAAAGWRPDMGHIAGALAGERGATRCVLQVVAGNDAALALYSRLGFIESHRYRYWVPASTCEDHTL